MTQGILAGFQVVELADPLTEFGAGVLAALGASVYHIEPPDGSKLRRRRPFVGDTRDDGRDEPANDRASIPFLARNLNKLGVSIDLERADDRTLLVDMIDRCDLVLGGGSSPFNDLVAQASHGNSVTITDRLNLGPSSIVTFAASGGLASSGWPDRPPCNAPDWLALDGASIYAACVGLIGAIARRRGAGNVRFEVPLEEAAVAAVTPWTRPLHSYELEAAGQGIRTSRLGPVGYPIYPTSDGYVRVLTATLRQWDAFVQLLGSPGDLVDGPWTDPVFRTENRDVLQMVCCEFTRGRTTSELFHEGQALGLTITPVSSLADFRADPHIVARELFVDLEDPQFGQMQVMRAPLRIDPERYNVQPSPAPAIGAHQDEARRLAARSVRTSGAQSDVAPERALEGMHVLELGVGAVVPEAASLLAAFGATVFKLESRIHPDFLRRSGIHGWGDVDGSATFNQLNLGIQSIAVDMTTAEGVAVVHEVAKQCDVVMENMRGGVVEKWGLHYNGVRTLRDDVIYLSSQGLGRGLYDAYQTFGPNLQTFSGVTSQWAHPDDPYPVGTTLNHPDHMAGKQALIPMLAAVLKRLDSGEGVHIDAAQVESAAYQIHARYLQASATGTVRPLGNASLNDAPHGCYPCRGDDRWIAIAVQSTTEWRALRSLVEQHGGVRLNDAAELDRALARRYRREELDAWLSAWTQGQEPRELEAHLRSAGIPASVVLNGDDIANDQRLHESGFYVDLDHPHVGLRTYTGVPVRIDGTKRLQLQRAPLLGEHTDTVLATYARMSPDALRALRERRIIGH